jgi:hypothetical protein
LEHFTQIVEDWETLPITDLAITHGEKCAPGFEDAIYKVWPGSVQYCDCTRSKDKSVVNYYPNKSCPKKCYDEGGEDCTRRTVYGCREMQPMWPVVMTDLGGYRVCAKRGGLPFKDAVRVNAEGKCTKAGFTRCNPDSDVENGFCVAADTVCPITSVKFANSLDELHDLL